MVELSLVSAERVDSTTQAQRTYGRTGRGTMVVLGFLLLFTHCTLRSPLYLNRIRMTEPHEHSNCIVTLTRSNTLIIQVIAVYSV